jgi:2-polyprenyl-6-methoxyphenol hydroxylase-like FAD-dependent oxidoreductase
MPTSPSNVIIIGAGTGGLCLAQGLKRAGISVAVYERDRTRADGLQGYRVGIDADGKRALRANLPPRAVRHLPGHLRPAPDLRQPAHPQAAVPVLGRSGGPEGR